MSLAKKSIDMAKKAGADAVKFQIFKTENVITKDAGLCNYQKIILKNLTLFELLKKVELNYYSFKKFINIALKKILNLCVLQMNLRDWIR